MGVRISVYLVDMNQYSEILSAYRSFKDKSDAHALVELTESAVEDVRSGKTTSPWSVDVYEEELAILTGKLQYSARGDIHMFVENSIAPSLVEALCIPLDAKIHAKQEMSGTALTSYLYSHSKWIEDYFTGAKEVQGFKPDITVGEWNRFFSQQEIESFDAELSRIPRPAENTYLQAELDNLQALVRRAATNRKFALLYVIS